MRFSDIMMCLARAQFERLEAMKMAALLGEGYKAELQVRMVEYV